MEDLLRNIHRKPKLSTPVHIIFNLIQTALAIAQILIGAMYLDDCPKQPYIPIYLLVSGVILLVYSLSSFPPCTRNPDGTQTLQSLWIETLVSLFRFCWLIAGSVWIYSMYQSNDISLIYSLITGTDYCNKTLYLFAFWTTTLAYILLFLYGILGILFLVCCLCGKSGNEDNV